MRVDFLMFGVKMGKHKTFSVPYFMMMGFFCRGLNFKLSVFKENSESRSLNGYNGGRNQKITPLAKIRVLKLETFDGLRENVHTNITSGRRIRP